MIEQDSPVVAPTSRMQYLHLPVVHPGKCACCGSIERPVVDFGMTIEFYGAVLLCVTCLAEAGQIVGLVPVAELRAAQESLAQSIDENLKQAGKVAITNEQHDSLALAVRGLSDLVFSFDDRRNSVDDVSSGDNEPDVLDALNGTEPESIEELLGVSGITEQESDASERKGPNGVSSDSGDGNPNFAI